MVRKPGLRALKESVLKEYNHRCAVCGTDRPQVHHIDENHENNDRLNLLPLCPNCHLSDQHNPTQQIALGILKLFRVHKDPAILSPQFTPLFERFQHVATPDSAIQFYAVVEKNDELVRFVDVLTMGTFYAEEIRRLLFDPTHVSISEAYGSASPSAIAGSSACFWASVPAFRIALAANTSEAK